MYHSAFQFNKEFLDNIYERIHALRMQYAHNKTFTSLFVNTTLFTNEQLERTIDTAYWASQALEEGNQIRISIVFRNREPSSNTFSFDNGVPLNPRNLVKLGSALESTFSDICICPARNGQIEIWGLRMRSHSHLTKNLWIQVLGPGHVLIICYGRIIAALIGNQAVFVDPSSFFITIIPKIFAHDTKPLSDPLKVHRFYTLLYIAQAMRAHERGGTLLIVPEGNAWKKSIGHPVIYTGGANFLEPEFISQPRASIQTVGDLLALLQEAIANKDQNFMFTRTQIIDQCNRIGRLTAIDGALVMTYDRYIHCFGAKIQGISPLPGSTEVRMMMPVEGNQEEKIIFSDLGGTRHTSAAQFAFDQPGSIAIVASQGSNVSFFTKDLETGELLVIQKAELALMYEGISGVIWNLSQFIER